jgi:cation diffusion facilitator CzcD-associated flavoprotein CzcO
MGIGFLWPRVNRAAQQVAIKHLHRQVRDPELRAKLTPTYTLGCKRVLLSNDYYPALTRDNVEVVTDAIRAVTPTGIVTADGTEHPVDTIVFGTGFHVTDMPITDRVRGRGGRLLGEAWTPTLRAHLGTMVAGFPNLFLLLGPNTGLGHSSAVLMIESQLQQVIGALRHMRRTGARAIEPTEAAQTRYNQMVDAKMDGTVWVSGGCSSWYLDASGRNSTIWPGFVTSYRLRTRRFRPGDYADVPAEIPTLVGQV